MNTRKAKFADEWTRMRVEPVIDNFSSRKSWSAPAGSSTKAKAGRRTGGFAVSVGSIACFLFMMAAPGGLLAARRSVVDAAPFTAGLYSALGLPVNLRGLEISGLSTRLEEHPAGRVLLVEGQVANISASAVPVPDLALAVRSADGAILYSWTSASPRSQLDANDRMTFRTRLVAPPDGARDVRVAFR